MSYGRFLIDRSIFESPVWQDPLTFRLFILILGKAMFKDGVKVGHITLKRGQWIRSYRNLQGDLETVSNRSVSRPGLASVKRCVDKLVKDGRIKIEESELGTLFTVVNYDFYQGFPDSEKGNLEHIQIQIRNDPGTIRTKDKQVKKDLSPGKEGGASLINPAQPTEWAQAETLLIDAGVKKREARRELGQLKDGYGWPVFNQAVTQAMVEQPGNPLEFLQAQCKAIQTQYNKPHEPWLSLQDCGCRECMGKVESNRQMNEYLSKGTK